MAKSKNQAGRNPNGTGGIYERKDGTYEVKFTVKDNLGNPKRKSKYFKAKKEAVDFNIKISNEILNNDYIDPCSITISQWIAEWRLSYSGDIKPTTRANYQTYIDKHITPNIGDVKLSKLTSKILNNFFRDLRSNGNLRNKDKPLSVKTIRNVYSMLKICLDDAVDDGKLKTNCCNAVKLPKYKKGEMRVLNKTERKGLIQSLDNLTDLIEEKNNQFKREKSSTRYSDDTLGYRYAIYVALYTGARVGEIMALKWKDVDFKEGCITINKTLTRIPDFENKTNSKTMLVLSEPKTTASIREVPLNKVLTSKLLEHIENQNKLKRLLRDTYQDEGFLFANDFGTPIEPRTIQDFFKKVLNLSQIDDANFHCLRHTFATQWLENGKDIKTLSEILGHTSTTFTLNTYVHCLKQHKFEQMMNFDY